MQFAPKKQGKKAVAKDVEVRAETGAGTTTSAAVQHDVADPFSSLMAQARNEKDKSCKAPVSVKKEAKLHVAFSGAEATGSLQ
jgi:hypothetical protein